MHNEDPSFSVVIPTYNHADFLMNALQSVVDQKYDYWEAIVIDNNSSDHTDEVVKSFNDPRIKLYKINNTLIHKFIFFETRFLRLQQIILHMLSQALGLLCIKYIQAA